MKFKLGKNFYGKNAVNISKIIRHKDYHEFRQLSVSIALQGDFETAHTEGDNSKILPTDTQKNTVYALAKEHLVGSIEDFGIFMARHFMNNNPQIALARISIIEHLYQRLSFDGKEHPNAYISSGNEKRTTVVEHSRTGISITSGIKDLLILKTTDSAFKEYIKDQYTTLKETDDRILATQCEAEWIYVSARKDFAALHNSIRNSLLKTFAFHKSLSVQQTLYAMGEEVLKNFNAVKEISLIMPNKHHILFNLEQFGMENKNEVFIATHEPFGYITGTVTREE
jgi:urate oxidase